MDDLFERGRITFIGVSIAVILISLAMEANGSAHAANPAWLLIHSLRTMFVGLWAIVIAIIGAAFLYFAVLSAYEAGELRKNQRIETELQAVKQIQEQKIRDVKAKEEKRRKEETEALARTKEQMRQEEILREIERRKSRSSEDATDEAMDDFG